MAVEFLRVKIPDALVLSLDRRFYKMFASVQARFLRPLTPSALDTESAGRYNYGMGPKATKSARTRISHVQKHTCGRMLSTKSQCPHARSQLIAVRLQL